jgi:hypothetical protein
MVANAVRSLFRAFSLCFVLKKILMAICFVFFVMRQVRVDTFRDTLEWERTQQDPYFEP